MSGNANPTFPPDLPVDPFDQGPPEPLGPTGSSNPDNPVNQVIENSGFSLPDLAGPEFGQDVAEVAMASAPDPALPDNLPVDPFDQGPPEPLGPTGSSNPDNPVNEVTETLGVPPTPDILSYAGPGFGELVAAAARSGQPNPSLLDDLPVDPFEQGPPEPLGPTGSSNPDSPVNEVTETLGVPPTPDILSYAGPGFGELVAAAAMPNEDGVPPDGFWVF